MDRAVRLDAFLGDQHRRLSRCSGHAAARRDGYADRSSHRVVRGGYHTAPPHRSGVILKAKPGLRAHEEMARHLNRFVRPRLGPMIAREVNNDALVRVCARLWLGAGWFNRLGQGTLAGAVEGQFSLLPSLTSWTT